MSPERKEYYRKKQRRMAFYIVENDHNNEENPPTVSAVIGLDKELEAAFLAVRRPPLEKRTTKMPASNKNGMHCPNMPTQWKNNLDLVIPKAEFGHFVPTRKAK